VALAGSQAAFSIGGATASASQSISVSVLGLGLSTSAGTTQVSADVSIVLGGTALASAAGIATGTSDLTVPVVGLSLTYLLGDATVKILSAGSVEVEVIGFGTTVLPGSMHAGPIPAIPLHALPHVVSLHGTASGSNKRSGYSGFASPNKEKYRGVQ